MLLIMNTPKANLYKGAGMRPQGEGWCAELQVSKISYPQNGIANYRFLYTGTYRRSPESIV